MRIFVFGSNESGIHGGGAALHAYRNYGAEKGLGFGPAGKSFAIPTVNWYIQKALTLAEIKHYVDRFIEYAEIEGDEVEFQITQIGCGIAGFTADQIAPLFKIAPSNCLFDEAWKPILGDKKKYWGTF